MVERATPLNFVFDNLGEGLSKENNLALRDLRIDDVSDADREADEELFAGDGDELLPDPGLEFEPAVFVCCSLSAGCLAGREANSMLSEFSSF